MEHNLESYSEILKLLGVLRLTTRTIWKLLCSDILSVPWLGWPEGRLHWGGGAAAYTWPPLCSGILTSGCCVLRRIPAMNTQDHVGGIGPFMTLLFS